MNYGEPFGAASVQYGDFKGTVAIDANPDSDAVYELAGLARSEWFIVGYEIYGDTAAVWAVGRDVAPNGYDDFVRLGRENDGQIPAHRVEIKDKDAATKLLKLNKRVSIRAIRSGLAEEGLDLVRIEND